jgi:hypothetical protein
MSGKYAKTVGYAKDRSGAPTIRPRLPIVGVCHPASTRYSLQCSPENLYRGIPAALISTSFEVSLGQHSRTDQALPLGEGWDLPADQWIAWPRTPGLDSY